MSHITLVSQLATTLTISSMQTRPFWVCICQTGTWRLWRPISCWNALQKSWWESRLVISKSSCMLCYGCNHLIDGGGSSSNRVCHRPHLRWHIVRLYQNSGGAMVPWPPCYYAPACEIMISITELLPCLGDNNLFPPLISSHWHPRLPSSFTVMLVIHKYQMLNS